jgi:predicted  nucleic acid-binding Zn-ribbon protein
VPPDLNRSLAMLKFLGFLFVVAVSFGAWGYFTGRFEVSKTEANGKTSIGVTIDNEKLSKDLDAVIKWGHDQLNALDRKIDELREKASKASAEGKAKIEQQIEALEKQKSETARELEQARDQAVDGASALHERLERALSSGENPTPVEKND